MRTLHLHPSSLAFLVGGDTTLCFAHLVSWLCVSACLARPSTRRDWVGGGPWGGLGESLYIFCNCNTTTGDGKTGGLKDFSGEIWGEECYCRVGGDRLIILYLPTILGTEDGFYAVLCVRMLVVLGFSPGLYGFPTQPNCCKGRHSLKGLVCHGLRSDNSRSA